MSVYGGDSWGREAQYRKRRVDDVALEALSMDPSSSSYKKLSSGKFACLICPHTPVLDTPLVLSMHIKGSRHRAAESSLKEKKLEIQNEIDKRKALAEHSKSNIQGRKKPLIEQARKAASDIVFSSQEKKINNNNIVESDTCQFGNWSAHSEVGTKGANKRLCVSQQCDIKERRERELKFTEAGWKRDGHGKWYRDEYAEFDSDEEDPNVSLA